MWGLRRRRKAASESLFFRRSNDELEELEGTHPSLINLLVGGLEHF